jgi:hypothetical protein
MKPERWYTEDGDVLYYLPFVEGEKDKLHRLDGPAIEYISGEKAWYYKGIKVDCQSQEEFEQKIKLLAFL